MLKIVCFSYFYPLSKQISQKIIVKKSLGRMHVAVIPSKQKNGKTYRATLIRQSCRDPNDKTKIRKRTLANISQLPKEAIVLLQNFLKGKNFVEADSTIQARVVDTKSYGHVHSVMVAR